MTSLALVFLVNIGTSLAKWLAPKIGKGGTQVVAFVLSILTALYFTYKNNLPGIEEVVTASISIFALAVAFYEVILQHIPFLKGKTK